MKKVKTIILIFLLGFILNFIWESFHARLYEVYESYQQIFPILIKASLWDTTYISVVYLIFAEVKEDLYWIKKISYRDILVIIFLGFIVATLVEWNALEIGKWSYTETMPIVPIINVGLTPFLQLPILTIITFGLMMQSKTTYS